MAMPAARHTGHRPAPPALRASLGAAAQSLRQPPSAQLRSSPKWRTDSAKRWAGTGPERQGPGRAALRGGALRVREEGVERVVSEGEGEGDEEAGEVDFSQGGWLWSNDAAAKTQAVLGAKRVRPKKSLGQNFVTDDDVLTRVVQAANIQEGDLVLEVGPGTGNLTRYLLAAGATVTSVEKDHRLVDTLRAEFAQSPAFTLIEGDILRMDPMELAAGIRAAAGAPEGAAIKVVANLPYYITTDVLKKYLPLGGAFSNLIFMLQEEVAQRFAIHMPGSRDYRYMSVYCRFFSRPEYKFRISRHLYFPKPKVDGAVVDFELLPPGERAAVASPEAFLSLVHGAFLHRRKMMKNSMALPSADVADALSAAGLNPESRAQDLSLDDFVAVHHQLESK
eukprot:jgi/Tetstr1/433853/TSEL_023036.t1